MPGSGVELDWGDVFACEPDWSWSVRDLPDLDLWYVTAGAGWISDGTRSTPIGAGDCLLLRTGSSYEAGHDPSRPLTLIAVHFDLTNEAGRPIGLPDEELPPFVRRMGAGELFRELLMRVVRCHQDGRHEWARAWLQTALLEVIRQDAQTWPPGLLGDQARKIEEICERIRRSPGQCIRVENLAAELHVSPEHFCRIFRRLQGMPPRAFISRTRMEAARALLLTSSHSISRIAELLGYQSPSYFSRQFTTRVGLSPSAFRSGDRRRSCARRR
ncbi:MAG: AraC family transcriptional regulator [Gemmatimonadota bacterium]